MYVVIILFNYTYTLSIYSILMETRVYRLESLISYSSCLYAKAPA